MLHINKEFRNMVYDDEMEAKYRKTMSLMTWHWHIHLLQGYEGTLASVCPKSIRLVIP